MLPTMCPSRPLVPGGGGGGNDKKTLSYIYPCERFTGERFFLEVGII